jgi:hypothetical protein
LILGPLPRLGIRGPGASPINHDAFYRPFALLEREFGPEFDKFALGDRNVATSGQRRTKSRNELLFGVPEMGKNEERGREKD